MKTSKGRSLLVGPARGAPPRVGESVRRLPRVGAARDRGTVVRLGIPTRVSLRRTEVKTLPGHAAAMRPVEERRRPTADLHRNVAKPYRAKPYRAQALRHKETAKLRWRSPAALSGRAMAGRTSPRSFPRGRGL